MGLLALSLIAAAIFALSSAYSVSDLEWSSYKAMYAKTYSNVNEESSARCNYAFNKQTIDSHNNRAAENLEAYTLDVNQFSDLRFFDFADLFPPTTEIASHSVPFILPPIEASPSFSYASQGFTTPVHDQGVACNSGWAYAAAVALKIFDDVNAGAMYSPTVSAQNFIDCAGASKACVNQVAQSAFDYLAAYGQRVYPTTEYPNNPRDLQGMCILPSKSTNGRTLAAYSSIPNGDDGTLKKVVNYLAPVVIEINPGTFEFMHYKSGVFTQPSPVRSASHYVTVVGYGIDAATSKRYWLLQNSFGTTWGEDGFIRVEVDGTKSIAKGAIFPSQ